jgi:hypothetical protein
MTEINLSLHAYGLGICFIRSIVFKLKLGRCIHITGMLSASNK